MVFAIIAMTGQVAVFAIETLPLAGQADAKGCERGGVAYNASQERCSKGSIFESSIFSFFILNSYALSVCQNHL